MTQFDRFLIRTGIKQPPQARDLPPMRYYTHYAELLEAPHMLVAGSTGSGKSVFINSFLWTLVGFSTPQANSFILLDPKRVELLKWKGTIFCAGYACDNADIIGMLKWANSEMDRRYSAMATTRDVTFSGAALWIVIDELADLMVTCKKDVMPLLQRIAQLGRAAKIHLLCATQSPSRKTIPAELTLNFTHKLALRCDSAIESRQIIGMDGAERLPKYGQGILRVPGRTAYFPVTMTSDEELKNRIGIIRNYTKYDF